MITVDIAQEFRSFVDADLVEETANTTLFHQAAPDGAELSIVITDDDQMRSLNSQFRDIDSPTDVLSFPADFYDPENEATYLGDIIISYPLAVNQAEIGGHAVIQEVQLLVVHGLLHLLGYDHFDQTQKTEMWAIQRDILQILGLENLKISENG